MDFPEVVYRDRDGDELSVTARNGEGNVFPDRLISITQSPGTKYERTQSVVLTESEVPDLIVAMVKKLRLNETQIHEIIEKLNVEFSERVTPVVIVCVVCGSTTTAKWWKCCSAHTSEQGSDVVCHACSEKLHPDKPQLKEPDNEDKAKEPTDPGLLRPVREGDTLGDQLRPQQHRRKDEGRL